MEFSTREEIEAPAGHVWAHVSDLAAFERRALQRGATVERSDPPGGPGEGTKWQASFVFRGKPREVEARIADFAPPERLRVDSASGGVEGILSVEVTALSPRRTRLQVALELTPRNLAGRLLVQSLKFARASLQKRFETRVGGFAQEIEARHRKAG